MEDITYTKGIYTATASIKEVQSDTWQGVVTLSRDEGDATADQETTALRSGRHLVDAGRSARRSQGARSPHSRQHRTLGSPAPRAPKRAAPP